MPISIFCLAISIVLGSWLILRGLSEQGTEFQTNRCLVSEQEIADYIGLSTSEVEKLMSVKGREISNGIPYLKIDNKIYFNKKAVNEWVENIKGLSISW